MAENKYLVKARLANKIVHNDKYLQLSFELLQPFVQPFQAGQYVSIKVGENGDLRSYSICSSPENQQSFDLLLDVTPQGLGTTFLQQLAVGAELEILGPLGRFCVADDQSQVPAVLIGTGSGVAPLRSMVYQQLKLFKNSQTVQLLWGERFAKDLIWLDEFAELVKNYSNFIFTPMVSKPEPTNQFQAGRVTALLETMDLPVGAYYYLCGNKDMIADATRILQTRGVPETQICFEKFY